MPTKSIFTKARYGYVFQVYRHSLRLLSQVIILLVLGVAGIYTYISLMSTPAADAKSLNTSLKTTGQSKSSKSTSDFLSKPALNNGQNTRLVAQTSTDGSNHSPTCSPDISYQLPTELKLTASGLTQTVDPASSYLVYGYTPAQIMAQIEICTPVRSTGGAPGTYVASTAYAIDWQFDYSTSASGLCSLINVEVGLHINQVFPVWETENSNPTLNANWQTYINKLHNYETGHLQLDESAATLILSDLQNLPSSNCADIASQASAQANLDISNLNLKNSAYDNNNNFGLSQGIVLQ
jgi:predicted secreted Zn-dependent protease